MRGREEGGREREEWGGGSKGKGRGGRRREEGGREGRSGEGKGRRGGGKGGRKWRKESDKGQQEEMKSCANDYCSLTEEPKSRPEYNQGGTHIRVAESWPHKHPTCLSLPVWMKSLNWLVGRGALLISA